jgi:hypothetical protein
MWERGPAGGLACEAPTHTRISTSNHPQPNGEFDPEAKAPSESLLARTAIDVYDTYAVFRCPDQYTSLGLLQGAFQLSPAPKGKGGKDGAAAGAAEGAGAAGAEQEAAAAAAAADDREGEEDDPKAVLSYAAWKTFPVRVNGLHPETSPEELRAAFAKVRTV